METGMKDGTFPPKVAVTYNQIMAYFDYDKNVDIFDGIVREHLQPMASAPQVLELGIGTGHFASRLANLGYGVVGIDDSPKMIEELHVQYPCLDARLQDIAELDLPIEFDVAVSAAGPMRFNYFEDERVFESYIPNWELTLEAIRGVAEHIRPGGLLIMSQNSDPEHQGFFKSTGDDMHVTDTIRYQKREQRDGQFIYKVRKLFGGDKEIWSIEHKFAWKTPITAELDLAKLGFTVVGFDPTNTYHISKR